MRVKPGCTAFPKISGVCLFPLIERNLQEAVHPAQPGLVRRRFNKHSTSRKELPSCCLQSKCREPASAVEDGANQTQGRRGNRFSMHGDLVPPSHLGGEKQVREDWNLGTCVDSKPKPRISSRPGRRGRPSLCGGGVAQPDAKPRLARVFCRNSGLSYRNCLV